MSIRFVLAMSEEEKLYIEKLINRDQDQDTCEMACDLLTRLGCADGTEEIVSERVETIPRADECENQDWEFITLTGDSNFETKKGLLMDGWNQSDESIGPPRRTTFRRRKVRAAEACPASV